MSQSKRKSAFLQGWRRTFNGACPVPPLSESVYLVNWMAYVGTFSLPPESTEMGTRWRLKLVRTVSSLPLLPWKDLLKLSVYVIYSFLLSHQSQRDTDVIQVFAGRAVLELRVLGEVAPH